MGQSVLPKPKFYHHIIFKLLFFIFYKMGIMNDSVSNNIQISPRESHVAFGTPHLVTPANLEDAFPTGRTRLGIFLEEGGGFHVVLVAHVVFARTLRGKRSSGKVGALKLNKGAQADCTETHACRTLSNPAVHAAHIRSATLWARRPRLKRRVQRLARCVSGGLTRVAAASSRPPGSGGRGRRADLRGRISSHRSLCD